jgi:hypothetical protein
MAASVRIEDEVYGDVRYVHLGQLLGTNHYDAIGRMSALWRQCTQEQTYVLPEAVVRVVLDPDLAIEARLAERVDGGIRIRGTRGRIEWLGKLRKNSKKGGAARKAKTKPNGYPSGSVLGSQVEAKSKPDRSPPSPSPSPSEISEHSLPARDPGGTEPVASRDLVARLANEIRGERADVVRRLQAAGVEPGAPGGGNGMGGKGETDAVRMVSRFLSRQPDPSDPAGEKPADRVRRLGRYVLAMLEAEARRDGKLERLRETIAFSEGVVDWALNTTEGQISSDRPRSEWGRPPGAKPGGTVAGRKGPLKVGTYVDGYRVEAGEV